MSLKPLDEARPYRLLVIRLMGLLYAVYPCRQNVRIEDYSERYHIGYTINEFENLKCVNKITLYALLSKTQHAFTRQRTLIRF